MKAFFAAAALAVVCTAAPPKPKNVLFLISDDMRSELNVAYGAKHMITPNLDKLANTGVTFRSTFTPFAICSASRNSFLSGRLPDSTQVYNFLTDFRHSVNWDNATDKSLPEYFKDNGYLTLGAGKTYHPHHPPNFDPPSWSTDRPYWNPYVGTDWMPSLCPTNSWVCVQPTNSSTARPFNASSFADEYETQHTLDNLDYAAQQFHDKDRPFFIALGVTKPHAKWNVPQYFYDQYMAQDAPLPENPYSPKNVPDIAFTAEFDGKVNFTLGSNTTGVPGSQAALGDEFTVPLPYPGNNTVPKWFTRAIRAGYWSAISLADYHLGLALDKLESLGLANDTLVVFVADHGYALGEQTEYAKHTNWENAVHVPMIIRAPWLEGTAGTHTDSFVNLVDLYKTMASLAGLPDPGPRVDGVDVSELLTNPTAQPRDSAISQYSRCPNTFHPYCDDKPAWCHNNCEKVPTPQLGSMGYTLRTNQWRYTAWLRWNGTVCEPQFDAPAIATELYAHDGPPGYPVSFDVENDNVVAANPDVAAALHKQLMDSVRFTSKGCPTPSPK